MRTTARSYAITPDSAPAFWQIGNLWRAMATGVQTDNTFCLLDQIVNDGGGGGPCTHTHTQDEGLYVVTGHCTFNAAGQTVKAGPGTFVSVPRHTEHSFTVDAPNTQLLNFYTPAGFDVLLIGISHPADRNEPPPPGVPLPPPRLVRQLAQDYGQTAILGMPFIDPAGPDNMATKPTPGATLLPFGAQASTAPSYWQMGGLWSVLASGEQTGGSYSLLEQLFPQGPAAPPHLHEGMDEAFYLLDGEATFLLGDRVVTAGKGAFVFVPRGTVHGFRVDSPTIRLLNLYTPAGFERTLTLLAHPTEKRELPPADLTPKPVPTEVQAALFNDIGMYGVAVADPFGIDSSHAG